MDNCELMDIIGRSFSNGEADLLMPYLAVDCEYISDYSNVKISSSEKIIQRMKAVNAKVEDWCRYTYSVIELESVMVGGMTLKDFNTVEDVHPCEYGILLYQYDAKDPVAVVIAMLNLQNKIKSIMLLRKKELFDITFYGDEPDDSQDDLPNTVAPLTTRDRQVKELRGAFSGQRFKEKPKNNENHYIWREADEYIKSWIEGKGYAVLRSQIFKDCIGYRCSRNNAPYTVYMYTYGQKKTTQLDGDYCAKLRFNKLSKDSTILIVYLNTKRLKNGNNIEYKVCDYRGNEEDEPELWRLSEVNGKTILEFYTGKEMMELTYKLMYAFNRNSMDVYNCIIAYLNPSVIGPGDTGWAVNSAFFERLHRIHEKYGDMKLGYVRYNDVVYSTVPYIDGYGFFGCHVDNSTNRIIRITVYPFDGGERKIAEFIKTDIRENEDLYKHIPKLTDVYPLNSALTERFSLKLAFSNGQIRKYVLPINRKEEKDEAVRYRQHVFTDVIWKTAEIVPRHFDTSPLFLDRGPAVKFKNNFCVSEIECYEGSTPYSEPELCNDTIYTNSKETLKRMWQWNVNALYEDQETGLIKTLLSGSAFNFDGQSTFVSLQGKRLCSLDFNYTGDFCDGLSQVGISGIGYGYVDSEMRFAIPMKYNRAEKFKNGKAVVNRNDTWYYIDKLGNETAIRPSGSEQNYQEVGTFSEGLCKVSSLKLRLMDLAYYSDNQDIAGLWGFIDETGHEIIPLQYIYANDFSGGIAIVCKGKWTIDEKDNKYWTEEELWGAIDKEGNEQIPFVFDEIKFFWGVDDVFMATCGGGGNSCWGVIDNHGNWLAEPIFEDIDYIYQDGLFAFYEANKWSNPDNVMLGIYDINQNKVIFEPQFFDVSFRDDGYIEVEVFDFELGRKVERIIDRDGREKFHSIYSSIHTWKEPYEVVIRDGQGERYGLIDKNGNVILPCKYDAVWSGISVETQRMIYIEDGKQGVRDFNDKIIIEPKYYEIHGLDKPFLTVRVGEKDNYNEGLITQDGAEVLPAVYEHISWCRDNGIICCRDGNCEMLQLVYLD